MENTYGYIRTSRQRIAGEAGSARKRRPCSSAAPASLWGTSIGTWASRAASAPTVGPDRSQGRRRLAQVHRLALGFHVGFRPPDDGDAGPVGSRRPVGPGQGRRRYRAGGIRESGQLVSLDHRAPGLANAWPWPASRVRYAARVSS